MFHADLPIVKTLAAATQCAWLNPHLTNAQTALGELPICEADVEDARARLFRFAPFIAARFPQTKAAGGLIESPLREIPAMKQALGAGIRGRLFAKLDCELPIAGSIKARGGIYEVLKHAETLALEHGFLHEGDDYANLNTDEARAFFSQYAVQVGSTGNLGLSIGIMSAAVGFRVTVHMSADAKQWKKDLLREKGVTVIEYSGDFCAAVTQGRRHSDADVMSYFIDDEQSRDLFMGYAVAAKRLDDQLEAADVQVDAAHPLFVYIPCGVGGGPGGIAFGLKLLYGNYVHVFFVEPVQSPCMLLGMATGLYEGITVSDIGLSGKTHADGLAVGRPSGFVGRVMKTLLSGEFTVEDAQLFDDLRLLASTQGLFAEPSACAAFSGVTGLFTYPECTQYFERHGLSDVMENASHIAWLTGGSLVPEEARRAYMGTHL